MHESCSGFVECVLITANSVAGLQKVGKYVWPTINRLGGLQRLKVHFDHRKACRRLPEVRRLRFVYRKPCSRLAVVWRVRFDHRKAFDWLPKVQRIRLGHRSE